jgi:putative membrane protein
MITPLLSKNDARAKVLIYSVSAVVFIVVVCLRYLKLTDVQLPFNKHIFAHVSAFLNGSVSFLLLLGLFFIRSKNFRAHRAVMMTAMIFSVIFLVSYIGHHLFSGETHYAGEFREFYFLVLITHIILAAFILPFILFAAYRALIGEYAQHKRLAKWVWPVWFYVAITGVLVYMMISPYYV